MTIPLNGKQLAEAIGRSQTYVIAMKKVGGYQFSHGPEVAIRTTAMLIKAAPVRACLGLPAMFRDAMPKRSQRFAHPFAIWPFVFQKPEWRLRVFVEGGHL